MKKKYKLFRPRIRSRHPSHSVLRGTILPLLPFRCMIRFGSLTQSKKHRIEINSVNAIKNSMNKYLMKLAFATNDVRTAVWFYFKDGQLYNHLEKIFINTSDLPFPVVVKKVYGSRNRGNCKIDNHDEFISFLKKTRNISNYIIEKYYNFGKEYRLHVTEEGCFYTCRKMLRADTPEENKWYKNNDNSVWILEENPEFDKPDNWNELIDESVKALKAVGLDVGAVDLRVQLQKHSPSFIILEINSAPSFGEITAKKYIEELPKLLKRKKQQYENII